jgi:8-oxo-dGTP diphosphatase
MRKTLLFLYLIVLPVLISAEPYRPPVLTTAAIIEVYNDQQELQGIVLIERGKAPFGKALPGGKVEYGETVEDAIRREMHEEVNLELQNLRQFHVYSDPKRDFRHHSVEVTFVAVSKQLPKAGDDAAKAFVVPLDEIPWDQMAFDHAAILQDYLLARDVNMVIP